VKKIYAVYGADSLSKSAGNYLLAFVMEISMSKMNLAPVDQSPKGLMKSWKINKHVSSMEIARELSIDHKSFTQSWIQKEAQYLSSSQVEC